MAPEPDRDAPHTDAAGVERHRAEAQDTSRRDVLETLGRFAYVAPALTLLAEPGLAHANYGGVPNGGVGQGNGNGNGKH